METKEITQEYRDRRINEINNEIKELGKKLDELREERRELNNKFNIIKYEKYINQYVKLTNLYDGNYIVMKVNEIEYINGYTDCMFIGPRVYFDSKNGEIDLTIKSEGQVVISYNTTVKIIEPEEYANLFESHVKKFLLKFK